MRRHISELPSVRRGKLIFIDAALLSLQDQATIADGNSLKPERSKMPSRYQRGFVLQRGKKKVWYGMYRMDVRTAEGIKTVQKQVRLGTAKELPTKHAARQALADLLSVEKKEPIKTEMTFSQLVQRWLAAEGPTMKAPTLDNYGYALHHYVEPEFGSRNIAEITREDIQTFLAAKAKTYSKSVLRSLRLVIGMTMGWACDCRYLEHTPCTRIRLPKQTAGRRVKRTVLSAKQVMAIAARLKEPYATLILFLYATGVRISEAIALTEVPKDNRIEVTRRVYKRVADEVKSVSSRRTLPIPPKLADRMRKLSAGKKWVFCTKAGTPLDPRNALNRHVRKAVAKEGIEIGGWHDFRHTLSTTLRRRGVHPKVVSDILGHSKVNLAMDTYDRTDVADLSAPLLAFAQKVLPNVTKSQVTA